MVDHITKDNNPLQKAIICLPNPRLFVRHCYTQLPTQFYRQFPSVKFLPSGANVTVVSRAGLIVETGYHSYEAGQVHRKRERDIRDMDQVDAVTKYYTFPWNIALV